MKKKPYTRPVLRKVTIDKEISMVMMSPFGPEGDPEGSLKLLNPLRWLR
ncbi:MAG: hypothetical protein K9J06_00580 [Flavobacteriales bacterium]|nr:hypothetical protein [Flavobacteriales bacterium]